MSGGRGHAEGDGEALRLERLRLDLLLGVAARPARCRSGCGRRRPGRLGPRRSPRPAARGIDGDRGPATTDRAGTCRPRSEPGVRRSPPSRAKAMSTVAGSGNGLNSTSTSEASRVVAPAAKCHSSEAEGSARCRRRAGRAPHHVLDHDLATAELDQRRARTEPARRVDQLDPHLASRRHLLAHRLGLALARVHGDRAGGRAVGRVVHDDGLVGRPVLLGGAAGAVPGGGERRRRPTAVGIIRQRALLASAGAGGLRPAAGRRSPGPRAGATTSRAGIATAPASGGSCRAPLGGLGLVPGGLRGRRPEPAAGRGAPHPARSRPARAGPGRRAGRRTRSGEPCVSRCVPVSSTANRCAQP